MTDADLAVEHLRATVASAKRVGDSLAVVNVGELAALLDGYDRLRLYENADREAARCVREEFEAGRSRSDAGD